LLTKRSGDKIVLDALELMNSEGVSSLAVVDNQHNVVGNISTADVKVRINPGMSGAYADGGLL
jgi:CBS domain-containing protein